MAEKLIEVKNIREILPGGRRKSLDKAKARKPSMRWIMSASR